VITDMMMPVMDGPATIRALRDMRADVRIIAASGLHGRGNDVHVSSIKSVRHFLAKPYTAGELLAALKAALAD
jgi:CheY-like chemotaxis protein